MDEHDYIIEMDPLRVSAIDIDDARAQALSMIEEGAWTLRVRFDDSRPNEVQA